MKVIQFKQQTPEEAVFELTDLERVSSAITFIACALDQLKDVSTTTMDATNGETISSAIKKLRFHKEMLKLALDDLAMLEGREPWEGF